MNFKQWFESENLKTKQLKTRVVTSSPKVYNIPDYPDKKGIVLGTKRPKDESGFCLHNPEINNFALTNSKNMFVVFAFVLFTIQKDWQIVRELFPDYIKWILQTAIRTDNWDYDKQSFQPFSNILGGNKNYKSTAFHVQKLWHKKDEIYEAIKNIYDSSDSEKDFKIFNYIKENIDGLGATKAAFASQLIIGKFGCIDSINLQVYDKIIRADIKKKEKKSAFYYDKHGDIKVTTSIRKYTDFLKELEDLYQNPISKIFWDDWCKIVHDRIMYSYAPGQPKEKIPKLDIFSSQNKDFHQEIKPYMAKSNVADYLNKAKIELGDIDKTGSGKGVSQDHRDLILRSQDFYDWFNPKSILKLIREVKTQILSKC